MTKRQCSVCGRNFEPDPRVPKQTVCTDAACKRERKRIWQQQKRQSDPDYRDNQRRSAKDWAQRHSSYWEEYRLANPDYAETNRRQQQIRNNKQRQATVAKMDASTLHQPLLAGRYRLTRIDGNDKAISGIWTVEITVLSGPKPRS
ncbi:MAG: hypothetical protein BWK72_08050 [Rhodoferax ferrireducens]|uniref:Uncharacterized protein n=2 Tax=Pseudomonadota TaxID=1224 RepID=A0A1Y1R057_9GAMM|nr:MAG: hypothetical protein BWK72_08050 [Rhodoferax ferrireducens]OQX17433.1 MAG: hypothetical protein BWK73_01835 [Thiothrix lacustris]